MFRHSKLAAGLAIAATAVAASAGLALADGVAAKPVYAAPADWSGVYFGVDSGYQWSSIDVKNPVTGFGISSDHNEWLVGGHIGVQHQWGLLVLGVEGGWQSAFVDRDGSSSACFNPIPVLVPGVPRTAGCSARLNDILTIGGRAGWAAGHWMPYITGGYASGGYDFSGRNPVVPVAGGSAGGATNLVEQAHARLSGWYIGGGFEWIVAPMWTAGLEYRHYDFGTGSTTGFRQDASLPAVALEPVRFDATTDTVMARVSWRWGREPAAAPLK
jgi:opacity protein-like surface antigen